MRGKIFFIAIIIVIILLLWQYLPAITIFGTQLTPGHKESQHEKYDDAGEGDIQEGYDSDGDGLLDTEEDSNNNGVFDLILDETDKLDPDSDDDGLKDGEEYQWWENRHTQQENSENIPAWLKLRHPELSEAQLYELYKPKGDLDRDGLVNILDIDSDNDGLLDGYEVNFLNTDPANPDSDFDGVLDSGDLRPLENIDSDLDGLADDWEQRYFWHLNFTGADNSDNDEYSNIEEYEMGLNPTLVDGSGGQLTLPNLSYEQFYKNDLDQRIFQVSSADFPKYWRMTAFDSYNGLKWDKSNVSLKSYQSSEIPEVTKYYLI